MPKHPVFFVGAGPGDVELITVKGQRLLAEADVIIYTGSLINTKLLAGCQAEKYDSAGLHLKQIIDLIIKSSAEGKKIVRLHTGDPSVFGAIREQMQALEENNIACQIVPGVSSAFGAAASLGKELTLPEVSQTVIITRMEGRTPVPERESIKSLAAHRATMMIFLSVSMLDKLAEDLQKGGYEQDTPAAVVYKATWSDEKIIRGTLASIAGQVRKANITKTAMVCVGRVFSDEKIEVMSKLYDQEFQHGSRN
ncbi:MAG: precorrin-4 C(11)-methyltransferase [Deltaproteobacteria bacterium]|nr:MAG: precorrin-4 C(11)-methyltransferase [Deltaproteobacteria bacterium]